jgi:hypothetical protein
MKKLNTLLVYRSADNLVDKMGLYKQGNKFFFYYILKNFFFTKNYKSTIYTVSMGSKTFVTKNKESFNYFIKKKFIIQV